VPLLVLSDTPIQYFADKALRLDRDRVVPKEQMYESYLWFCREKKIAAESEQSFSRKLSDIGFKYERFRLKGKRVYCWTGVELKDWKKEEDTEQQTLTELTEEQQQDLR
jgi:hypothetical protein